MASNKRGGHLDKPTRNHLSALDQLSVGFMPIKNRKRPDGVMERIKAHLAEVSLVTFGAYGEMAAITGMREGQPKLTPRLDEARKILDAIQRSK